MSLRAGTSEVLDFYEPWKVRTGYALPGTKTDPPNSSIPNVILGTAGSPVV